MVPRRLAAFALLAAAVSARAEHDWFLVGDGGTSPTISATGAILNDYAQVSSAVNAGDPGVSVTNASVNSTAGFAPGRLVMIIQTTGTQRSFASGDQAAVDLTNDLTGRFELAKIASITGTAFAPTALTFTAPVAYAYPALVTQVVVVPEYDALTVSSTASVVPQDYNQGNHTGGVVALLVKNTLRVDGAIDATATGFRSGAASYDSTGVFGCTSLDEPDPQGAGKGETIAPGLYGRTGYGNLGSGGGGGDCHNSGGGGGGHGGQGGNGGYTYIGDGNGRDVGGRGGAAVTYSPYSRATFGGGAGGGQGNDGLATAGGRGGGLIWVRAGALAGSGQLRANGGSAAAATNDGAGGGGAGGAIYARFINGAACNAMQALGGAGGNLTTADHGPGGGGGGGMILLQAASLSCPTDASGGAAGVMANGPYGAQTGGAGRAARQAGGIATPPASAVTFPDAGALLNNNRPTITGTGPLGARVAVVVDRVEQGRPPVDGAGSWSLPLTTALSEASHTVVAKTEVDGLFHPGSAPVTFTVDSVPPDTSISSPSNTPYSNVANPVFVFTGTESGSTFECRQDADAGPYSNCASPYTVGPLQDGLHRFEVRAVDRAGNVDPTPAVRNWTLDTVPPDTSFDSGPPPLLNVRAATFQISSNEPGATMLCKLDSALAFSSCSAAPTFTVPSDGTHVLQAEAQDRASNIDPTPATYTWTVDTVAPSAGFAGPPPAVTGTLAYFDFSCSEPGCTFEVALDTGPFSSTPAAATFSALALGTHQVQVRATDPAGNAGGPATFSWNVQPDSDGDGLTDTEEISLGTDPNNADSDRDGLGDGAEVRRYKTDPLDDDTDDDGLKDGTEVNVAGTDPLKLDTDGDGLTDGLELGLTAPEGSRTSLALFRADADPSTKTDPLKADTDGDGLSDGEEDQNADGARQPTETDPLRADTDGDGLLDGVEVKGQNPTDPTRPDTDGDGLLDGEEDKNQDGAKGANETDPNMADTDQGGVPDGAEVRAGTNPLDPADDVMLSGGGLCGCAAGSAAPWALAGLLTWAWVRRRRRSIAPLMPLLAVAVASSTARAQSLDLQQFKPAPGAGAMLDLHGARSLPSLQVRAGLSLTYANAPLVLRAPASGQGTAVVSNQATADVLAAIGFLDRLELGLAIPVTVQGSAPAPILGETYAGGVAPAGIGDLRLVPKATLLDLSGFRVGLAATVTFPTGSGAALMGQGGLGARPRLLLEYELEGRARFALNAGANLRREVQLLNLTVGSELAASAAAEVALAESLSVAGGLSGAYGLAESRPEDRPLELLAEVRYALPGGLATSFGAGLGLTHGYGTPLFRVMAGVAWSQRTSPSPAGGPGPLASRAPCRSSDSLRDDEDACPQGPASAPVSKPAPAPRPPPSTVAAKVPSAAPPPPAPPKPAIKDADHDGVPDALDLCPDDPGPGDPDGCPPDSDHDGIPDYRDKCPTQPETLNGYQDDDGCPDTVPGKAASKKKKHPGRRR